MAGKREERGGWAWRRDGLCGPAAALSGGLSWGRQGSGERAAGASLPDPSRPVPLPSQS